MENTDQKISECGYVLCSAYKKSVSKGNWVNEIKAQYTSYEKRFKIKFISSQKQPGIPIINK